ncbi:MAG: DUF3226 domain-containing protein [Candidatus Puniceispirillales bacterium]
MEERYRVGVFILPDGVSPGSIETLCKRTLEKLPSDHCIASFIDCMKQENSYESNSEDKTYIHAFLSSRGNPMRTVGEAAHAKVWDFSNSAFDELAEFVEKFLG